MYKANILFILSFFLIACSSSSNSEMNTSSVSSSSKPKACNFLEKYSVSTEDYVDDASEENEKVCFSNYVGIGTNKENNMAYYAYGTENQEIEQVVLTFELTNKSDEKSSLQTYSEAASHLYQEYTGKPLSKKYINKIRQHQDFKVKVNDHSISLEKNGKNSTYVLVFEVK